MSKSAGLEIGLDDDDHIEWLGKTPLQYLGLIDAGLDMALATCCDKIFLWYVAIVDFLAVLLAWTFAPLLAVVDEVQGGIMAQFGDKLQAAL